MTQDENRGASSGRNRLRRSRQDRVLGGVCAGSAERFDVDALLIRIAAVALGLISNGIAVFAYLLAWVIVPSGGSRPQRPGSSAVRAGWTPAGGEWRTRHGRQDRAAEVAPSWPTS